MATIVIAKLQKSPLKPVVRIQNNLVEMVTGWLSTNIANVILQNTWQLGHNFCVACEARMTDRDYDSGVVVVVRHNS